MQRDQVDPTILDLDPEISLESQRPVENVDIVASSLSITDEESGDEIDSRAISNRRKSDMSTDIDSLGDGGDRGSTSSVWSARLGYPSVWNPAAPPPEEFSPHAPDETNDANAAPTDWSSRLGYPSDWKPVVLPPDVLPEELTPNPRDEADDELPTASFPLNKDPVYAKFYKMLKTVSPMRCYLFLFAFIRSLANLS